MKKVLFILLFVITCVNVAAAQNDYEHVKINGLYYYVYTKGESTGIAYVAPKDPKKGKGYSPAKDLEIPSSVNYKGKEYTVKGIDRCAFFQDKELTSVIIPNTVEVIGTQAFSCTNLQEIIIPNSVRKIKNSAFENCANLVNITIGNSVTKIETATFQGCCSLKNITMGDNITEIGAWAFSGCKSLEHITMGDNITEIGAYAFSGCKSLEHFTIPSSVKVIKYSTFQNCTSLQKMSIPHSVEKIEKYAFSGCKLQEIVILNEDIKLELDKNWSNDLLSNYIGPFVNCTINTLVYGNTNYPITGYGLDLNTPIYYSATAQNAKKIAARFMGKAAIRFAISEESIIAQIDEWQKKKEFETIAQWKQRVTETTRNKKVQEIVEDATQKMIKRNSSLDILRSIGTYDMDYGILPINTCYGTSYFKINSEIAKELKQSPSQLKLYPTYTLNNDYIAIASLKMEYKGNIWNAEPTVEIQEQDLALNLPPLEMNFDTSKKTTPATKNIPQNKNIDNTIDTNIPSTSGLNDKTFVVIIGNEKYLRVAKVPFAQNDAKVFATYCQKTLGIPEKNIRSYENATYGTLISALDDIKSICDVYNGNIKVIFYYAGHGIPNEQTCDAYLLPVDADGRNTSVCLSLNTLYKELGNLKSQVCIAFIDACFSGAERGSNMLASARGVAIKSKQGTPEGKLITFSAASGDETAYPYIEKGHGLFTYFLLKKLQETSGNVTLGELGTYVTEMVRQHSITENKKLQTPVMKISTSIASDWRSIKLK